MSGGQGSSARGPRSIGPYRILQRIGEGGMGVVHLALAPDERAVALKVLRESVAADPEARLRLTREVDTLRRVRHPRVAEVLDADVAGDRPYLVTRFVPGRSLEDHVRDEGPLAADDVVHLGRLLAEALSAIHALGIVHRDVKPANVMVVDGDPVLIDFGIAHVADQSRITLTGLVMGTPGYLSPEVVAGHPVTPATDWWGWGCTLAFAASGRPPFGEGPTEAVLDRVRRGACDLSGIPPRLAPVLAAALTVEPAWRPRADVLLAGLDGHGPLVRRPTAPPAPPVPSASPARPAPVVPRAPAALPTVPAVPPAAVAPPAAPVTVPVPPPTVPVPPPAAAPAAAAQAGPGQALTVRTPPPPAATVRTPPPPGPTRVEMPPTVLQAAPAPTLVDRAPVRPSVGASGPPGAALVPSPPPVAAPPAGPPAAPAAPAPATGPAVPPRPPAPPASGRTVLLALLVALSAMSATAPGPTACLGLLLVVVARTVDRSRTGLSRRRETGGRRSGDVAVTVLALPWRLVLATLASVLAAVVPALVGASTAFLVGTAIDPVSPRPVHPAALATAAAATLAMAWWGPGGGSVRRGGRAVARACERGRVRRLVVLGLLVALTLSALLTVAQGVGPDFTPFGPRAVGYR